MLLSCARQPLQTLGGQECPPHTDQRDKILSGFSLPEPGLIELAPSILSADFARLSEQVRAAGEGGAAVIHVDIMDGHFVPNLTIGPPVVKSLRKVTDLPLDGHLMT